MKIAIAFAAVICMTLSGCTTRMVDFTVISTKNVDLTRANTFKRGNARVKGDDVAHMILYFPIGMPNLKDAIDRCLQTTPGAVALVDGVVYSRSWWAILYGQNSYIVEGTPLIDPSLATSESSKEYPEYSMVAFNKNGQISEHKTLSENEYKVKKARILGENIGMKVDRISTAN